MRAGNALVLHLPPCKPLGTDVGNGTEPIHGLRLILQRVGLDTWFDAVIDGNQITRSKPDPEVFLRAAQALGFPPARCLVVEDADAGVEAALRGGFPCAGIGPAARNPNVTRPLSSLSQLLQILP